MKLKQSHNKSRLFDKSPPYIAAFIWILGPLVFWLLVVFIFSKII